MSRKKINKFNPLFGLIGFLIFSIGCSPQKAKVYSQTPIPVSAEALYREYKDETVANTKYLGKLMDINGTIIRMGEDSGSQEYVILKGGDGAGDIQCFFIRTKTEEAKQLKIGQEVFLRGICIGKIINVAVDECVILKS